MGRRKRFLDDGDDSDSSNTSRFDEFDVDNGPDAREERELFENPYQRKRRKHGKEDALYGIFGEESDDGADERGSSSRRKRSDWAKAPAFVQSDTKVDLEAPMVEDKARDEENSDGRDAYELDGEGNGSEGEDEDGEGRDDSDDSEPSRPPSPRIRTEEEEDEDAGEKSHMGGIGSSRYGASAPSLQTVNVLSHTESSPSLGFGIRKGGIGMKTAPTTADSESTPDPDMPASQSISTKGLPSTFGNHSRRFARPENPVSRTVALSSEEKAQFNKLQSTFGARMLAKMGWQTGTGLGSTSDGIVTPIQSKLRPQKMGIAFKGFKEKTEQSKMEARRRGEIVSDDEEKARNKKSREQEQKRSDLWKRPKKVKTKVEHKTYEQILAEAGQDAPISGIGQVIDATGAVPREVSSLADISINFWSPSSDLTRIPEVRHNIRVITDACKTDLDGLAREAKALEEHRRWVADEDARLRKQLAAEAELISRLQQVQLVANEISIVSKTIGSSHEISLEPLSPLVHKLVDEFPLEFDAYQLDEIVVAAIEPLIRSMMTSWNPLDDPGAFVSSLRSWKRALKTSTNDDQVHQSQVDVFGSQTLVATTVDDIKPMTPFESLLWNVWLPRVRSAINNDWSPDVPQPAIKLYESWSSFLPPFIRDNLMDQLLLPKVQKAVADWHPNRSRVSLQAILFPWLPHVGLRLEEVVGDAQRKVKSLLRAWRVGNDYPLDLIAWKEVFELGEWDALMLKYVVPKLGATLRNDFTINPRDQKMEPLLHVLKWADVIRPSIFSQILESEFFPKWLDILYIWLIQTRFSYDEVSQWYTSWKAVFPEHVKNMTGVSRGLTRALQLMNSAIELGPDAPLKLIRPDFRAELSATRSHATEKPAKPRSARTHEITFRSIVEDFMASRNLLFIPTGRAHELSRMPLFRVSTTADGKKGLLVYILDDVVWAPKSGSGGEGSEFAPISLDDMVLRMEGK